MTDKEGGSFLDGAKVHPSYAKKAKKRMKQLERSAGYRPWWSVEPSFAQQRSVPLRMVSDELVRGGTSNHSSLGNTMVLMIERLEALRVPYCIMAFPGQGYTITGMPDKIMAPPRRTTRRFREGPQVSLASNGRRTHEDG